MIPSIVSISVQRHLNELYLDGPSDKVKSSRSFGSVMVTIEKSGRLNGNRVLIRVVDETIDTTLERAKQLAEDLRLAITQAETEDLA